MSNVQTEATKFGWLLADFARSVPSVNHAFVVSADGLLMAMSDDLDRNGADQMAAIVSGLSSLTRGAARELDGGDVRQFIVEMDHVMLFAMAIGDGSILAVAADALTCEWGLVAHEMIGFIESAKRILTPQLVTEMRSRLRTSGPATTGVQG